MEKRTLAAVDQEIAETQEALKNVRGSETEVYARIVGYYRAVRNWNKGKRDEFNHRKMFTLEDSGEYSISDADKACGCSEAVKISNQAQPEARKDGNGSAEESDTYEFFARRTCPNCPPVKAYVEQLPLSGRVIDVDTEEGLAEAAGKGVFAAPTVIVYDASGAEKARAHNVEELTAIFEPAVAEAAV